MRSLANIAMDLSNMEKHWNMMHFTEGDAAEHITAVHICAYGNLIDGRLPDPDNPTEPDDPNADIPMSEPETEDHDGVPDIPPPPPKGPNHWVLFLELKSGAAVKLDMSPGYQHERPYREGTILASSKPQGWLAREGVVRSMRFFVLTPEVTVAQVLENMTFNTRHRYLFSDEGSGSRYWVYTVVLDLERAQLLGEGEAERTAAVVETVWGKEVPEEERKSKIRRGMFTHYTIRGEPRGIFDGIISEWPVRMTGTGEKF